MQINLRIAIWNTNGVHNHTNEIKIFIKTNYIDIVLASEPHFTKRTFFKKKDYDLDFANHPDNRAHAGTAILIKSNLKHEIFTPVEELFCKLQVLK